MTTRKHKNANHPQGKRNKKCPCGSGKKYKNCCMEKDLQAKADAELAKISDAADGEVPVVHAFPTWKLFLIGLGALLLLFVTFLVLDLENVGAAIFMAGLLVLTLYSAFRSAPPLRKHPGGGGNIDFGNR